MTKLKMSVYGWIHACLAWIQGRDQTGSYTPEEKEILNEYFYSFFFLLRESVFL